MKCIAATSTSSVRLRVLTNSLPNHCYFTDVLAPVGSSTTYNLAGFEVNFNLPTLSMYKATGLKSNEKFINTLIVDQSDLDLFLCD
jgi:hypothetical protein